MEAVVKHVVEVQNLDKSTVEMEMENVLQIVSVVDQNLLEDQHHVILRAVLFGYKQTGIAHVIQFVVIMDDDG